MLTFFTLSIKCQFFRSLFDKGKRKNNVHSLDSPDAIFERKTAPIVLLFRPIVFVVVSLHILIFFRLISIKGKIILRKWCGQYL